MDVEVEDEYLSDQEEGEEDPQIDADLLEPPDENFLYLGVARVPLVLLPSTAAVLQRNTLGLKRQYLPRAWMRAIAETFPRTTLARLRASNPCLLPAWLLQQGFETFQVQIYRRTSVVWLLSICVPPMSLWMPGRHLVQGFYHPGYSTQGFQPSRCRSTDELLKM
jgi:hypothetical protein